MPLSVIYMHFFHSFWKNLHLTENFYTDMSVVSVTNKRYVLALFICTWYNLNGKSICTIANLILLAFSCNQIHLPTTHYTYKIFHDYFYKIIIFFTCVKTAGLPCSNISSNSSLVVVRPAEQKDLVLTGSWFLSSNREENILNRFSLNRLIWFLSSNIEEYILNSQFLGSDINFSAASSTRN